MKIRFLTNQPSNVLLLPPHVCWVRVELASSSGSVNPSVPHSLPVGIVHPVRNSVKAAHRERDHLTVCLTSLQSPATNLVDAPCVTRQYLTPPPKTSQLGHMPLGEGRKMNLIQVEASL